MGWIPVTERLPDTPLAERYSEDVLIALKNHSRVIKYSVGWYDSNSKMWNVEYENSKVVAWRPLPKYKENNND